LFQLKPNGLVQVPPTEQKQQVLVDVLNLGTAGLDERLHAGVGLAAEDVNHLRERAARVVEAHRLPDLLEHIDRRVQAAARGADGERSCSRARVRDPGSRRQATGEQAVVAGWDRTQQVVHTTSQLVLAKENAPWYSWSAFVCLVWVVEELK